MSRVGVRDGLVSLACLIALAFLAAGATFTPVRAATRLPIGAAAHAKGRYGALKVVPTGDGAARLLFNGRILLKSEEMGGSSELHIVAQTRIGARDLYVVEADCCSGCPSSLAVVDVGGARAAHVKNVDDCVTLADVWRSGDEVWLDLYKPLRAYFDHPARYIDVLRWRYGAGRLRRPGTSFHGSPRRLGVSVDLRSLREDQATAADLRRRVRRSAPLIALGPGDFSRAGAAEDRRLTLDPFLKVPAGEWRSVSVRGRVAAVIGVSTDGGGALVVSEGEHCDNGCREGPRFDLVLRDGPAPRGNCTDRSAKAQVDGEDVQLHLWPQTITPGVEVAADKRLLIAPSLSKLESLNVDGEWDCFDWEIACVERSPLLRLKGGSGHLTIWPPDCGGPEMPLNFDLARAPFFSLQEWPDR